MRNPHPLDYGQAAPNLGRLIARASLPPALAIVSWTILYFTFFLAGLPIVLLTLIACAAWAEAQSRRLAPQFAVVFQNTPIANLRRRIIVLQGIGILGSWPLFGLMLAALTAAGFRVGWS